MEPVAAAAVNAATGTARRSALTSVLLHTAALSGAIWITVRAWPAPVTPTAAQVASAEAVAASATDDLPTIDPLPPALPAPADAAIPLPDDPVPPDDSVESAPSDAPRCDAPEVVAFSRDWAAITQGYDRRVRPPTKVAGPAPHAVATDDAGIIPPRPLVRRPPVYPPEAERRGEQGTVRLSVLVGADGLVREVRVAESSGSPWLDAAAIAAARAWRFEPARAGAAPIPAWVDAPVRFQR